MKNVSSPAGKPRRVFHCADAGHPQPAKPASEESHPISQRPKRKSGRPAAGLAQPRDEHGADRVEGAAENVAKRAAQLAEGNVAAIPLMNRLSPLGQRNPVAFELPPIHSPQDCLRATSAILTGIAGGDIAPSRGYADRQADRRAPAGHFDE